MYLFNSLRDSHGNIQRDKDGSIQLTLGNYVENVFEYSAWQYEPDIVNDVKKSIYDKLTELDKYKQQYKKLHDALYDMKSRLQHISSIYDKKHKLVLKLQKYIEYKKSELRAVKSKINTLHARYLHIV